MNRLVLFAWHDNEAKGGMNDFIDDYYVYEKARMKIDKLKDKSLYDIYEIWDMGEKKKIYEEGTLKGDISNGTKQNIR